MRLIFMGTPQFALPALKALAESEHDIVAVYTQPPRPAGRGQKDTPSPVHEFALEKNIPVFTPASLKSPEAQAEFAAHKAEVAVVVAYGLLLPKPILETCPMGCINVHPSLLPRWRGAAPIQRTIMAGDRETAICIMQMDEGLDTGDILLTEYYKIPEGTNAGTLHDTLAEKAAPLVLKALAEKPARQKQPESGVEYAKKISKAERHIDWNQPAQVLYHRILGLSPSPGATFTYNNEIIKLFNATVEDGNGAPGMALDDSLLIACGSGALRLQLLQRPGRKRVTAEDLLRGFDVPAGSILY